MTPTPHTQGEEKEEKEWTKELHDVRAALLMLAGMIESGEWQGAKQQIEYILGIGAEDSMTHPTLTQEQTCCTDDGGICCSGCPNCKHHIEPHQPSEGWEKEWRGRFITLVKEVSRQEYLVSEENEPLTSANKAWESLLDFASTLLATARREEREGVRREIVQEIHQWFDEFGRSPSMGMQHFYAYLDSLLTQKKGE